MRRRYVAALALAVTVVAAAPAAASTGTNERCAAGFHAARPAGPAGLGRRD